MSIFSRKLPLLGLACGSALATGLLIENPVLAQTINLVSNGDFEAGDLTDWTVSGDAGSVVVVSSVPSSGAFSAAFSRAGTPNTGVISQDLTTIIGASYSLAFDYGVAGSAQQSLQVELLGAGSLLDQTVNNSGPITYTTFNFNFIADATTTTLQFSDQSVLTPIAADGRLDNVAVSQVIPEPTTVWGTIAAIGMGVAASLRHQSRRR